MINSILNNIYSMLPDPFNSSTPTPIATSTTTSTSTMTSMPTTSMSTTTPVSTTTSTSTLAPSTSSSVSSRASDRLLDIALKTLNLPPYPYGVSDINERAISILRECQTAMDNFDRESNVANYLTVVVLRRKLELAHVPVGGWAPSDSDCKKLSFGEIWPQLDKMNLIACRERLSEQDRKLASAKWLEWKKAAEEN